MDILGMVVGLTFPSEAAVVCFAVAFVVAADGVFAALVASDGRQYVTAVVKM